MGFSGGGSNLLKAHKHSSNVQDGGKLDMDNVTEAELTLGDIVYSNGSALQRLAIGTPAQQLQVNAGATAPEYFTPAAAPSVWEELANVTATSGTSLTTPVFAEKKYLKIWSYLNVSAGMSFLIGNTTLSTAGVYCQTEMYTDGTTVATGNQASRTNFGAAFYQSNGQSFTTMQLYNLTGEEKIIECHAYGSPAGNATPGGLKDSMLHHTQTLPIDIVGWTGSTISHANIVVWGRD